MNNKSDITTGIRHDLFADIQYERSMSKKGLAIGKRLGRPWVFQWIFNAAWKHFSAAIANADWRVKQCSKSLFGDAAEWGDFKFGIRQAFGRCLRYFVDQGMLPLRLVNPNATGTKFYTLISV
jgi:hypothetical protein